MSPVPFRHQPSFRAVLFAIVLAATWVYDFSLGEDRLSSLAAAGLDLLLLCLLILACLFFFAQFVLPVRTLSDRLRIWGRVLRHARNAHGAAIFVQNGRRVERRGEGSKRGPGLLWIDTASAAMIRTEEGPKRVLGPGIHFTETTERIENIFSLHPQTCSIGPAQDEPIFRKLAEDASEEDRRRHASTHGRRQAVSGLTRDGHEVVPEIRVVFKLDGPAAPQGKPGSHFGYRKELVERAARGEGVNVGPVSTQRQHVAWNQLPGLIAVDLWREYLAKFTLDDLFSTRFEAVPEVLQPEEPIPEDAYEPQPVVVRRDWLSRMLFRTNNSLEARLRAAEAEQNGPPARRLLQRPDTENRLWPDRDYTALQIIAHMVRARMTQAAVPNLDECGRLLKGHIGSEEYRRLTERGLRILDVTLGGCRFDPAVEEQLVQQWRSGWLANASNERIHVEHLEVLATEAGKQQALLERANMLAGAIRTEAPASIPAALRAMLHASRSDILTDDRLHGRGSDMLDELSVLLKWIESPSND